MNGSKRRVWVVTGTSRGFGHALAEAAVAAGDVVVATARCAASLQELAARHPDQVDQIQLDVTDHAAIATVVADVVRRHGRIDVLVNNAGRTHVGAVEETTDAELRSLFEVHFFGPDSVGQTRAMIETGNEAQPGDPAKAAAAILKALDAEHTPLRLPLGSDAVDAISAHLDSVRSDLTAWEHIARGTALAAGD